MLGGSGDDAVVVNAVSVGGTDVALETLSVTTGEVGGLSPIHVSVYTAPPGGDVVAGIPRLDITVTDPLLGDAGVGDPIFFLSLSKRSDGTDVVLQNQYRPVRGYGALPGACRPTGCSHIQFCSAYTRQRRP